MPEEYEVHGPHDHAVEHAGHHDADPFASRMAVITAIGPVHLERFKSLETTMRAKSEIAVGASIVVVNDDDPYLTRFADDVSQGGQRVLRCSATGRLPSVVFVLAPHWLRRREKYSNAWDTWMPG